MTVRVGPEYASAGFAKLKNLSNQGLLAGSKACFLTVPKTIDSI